MEYNNAKVQAETRFFADCSRLGLEGFALRPGIVYGPRSRWISDLAADLRGGQAWLYRDGSTIFNGIYVDNLCHAILQCLQAPGEAAGPYLVGDAETCTWAEFTHAAAERLSVSTKLIHTLETLPVFTKSRSEQFRNAMTGPLAQAILPLVPGGLKRTVKRLLEPAQGMANAWALPGKPGPRLTEELVLLQQCTWRFPCTKAQTQLQYKPSISFNEGMKRSFDWLAFAEGRPC